MIFSIADILFRFFIQKDENFLKDSTNEGKMGVVRNMSKNLREEGSKRGEVCQEFEDLSEGQNS